jgi:hypothetical protein
MAVKKTKGKIPGQGQPVDASTDLFWRDNKNFAEVFSKAVFNGLFVNPDQLVDLNVAESTMLRLKDGATTTLKQTRDVIKALSSDGAWLVILGVENQTHIDFLMPFRVWELNFINVARQVDDIRKKHQAERDAVKKAKEKGEVVQERHLSEAEILSGFYSDDKLTPVITLVIYYGQEEWRSPLKLSDLFKDSLFTGFADDMPMYLLDVRHMSKEKLDSYSPALNAFFGFLVYDHTDEFDSFIAEHNQTFSDLPDQTIDALIEITHSSELEKYKKDYRTAKGGVNVCYGIQESNKRTFVEAAQRFGQTITATITAFIEQFHVSRQDAELTVKKYWKNA